MTEINIGGKKIPLRLTTNALKEINQNVGNVLEINDWLLNDQDLDKQIGNMLASAAIMGRAGLKTAGEEYDWLTEEWIGDNTEPGENVQLVVKIVEEMNRAMKMETQVAENRKNDRDLVLEEIERKKDPEASAGDS